MVIIHICRTRVAFKLLSYMLSFWIFTNPGKQKGKALSHFTDEDTEGQRDETAGLGPASFRNSLRPSRSSSSQLRSPATPHSCQEKELCRLLVTGLTFSSTSCLIGLLKRTLLSALPPGLTESWHDLIEAQLPPRFVSFPQGCIPYTCWRCCNPVGEKFQGDDFKAWDF